MDARKLKVILLKVVSMLFLLLICSTVISQGLRSINSAFTWKLAKLPGLRFLAQFEGWHRIDIATVCAVGLLLVEYFVLITALRYYLVPGAMRSENPSNWNPENDRTLTWIGFVALTLGETLLFFVGVMGDESGWDSAGVLTALVGSLLYMSSIVFIAYFTVRIERGN
jgi:hypothetical protein